MNEENKQEEKLGLLRRAYARLRSSKLVKKVAALGIAAVIAFNFYGCDTTPTPDDNTIIDNGTNKNNGHTIKDDFGNEVECSELLYKVVNNTNYCNLISRAKGQPSLYETGYFDPHPYGFLEDKGYDINAIKNNEIPCFTMSYVLDEEPNNLYIYTRVKPTDNQYDNYLIRYTLTDQEMDDYHYLHTGDGNSDYFIQAAFINDQISKTKTPTIVGSAKFKAENYDRLTKQQFKLENAHSSHYCIIAYINPNTEDNTVNLIFLPDHHERFQVYFSEHKESVINNTYKTLSDLEMNNNIVDLSYYNFDYILQTSTSSPAVFYSSQEASYDYIKCENLKD